MPASAITAFEHLHTYDLDHQLVTLKTLMANLTHSHNEVQAEQGLTSHQTHYRSYRGWLFTGQMT